MGTTRITPRFIWSALGLHLSLRLIALWLLHHGHFAVGLITLDTLRVVGSLVAYVLAFFICWNVAEEYRGTRGMRWDWLALTMDAGLSLLRPFSRPFSRPFVLLGQTVDWHTMSPVHGLFLYLVLVPANFFYCWDCWRSGGRITKPDWAFVYVDVMVSRFWDCLFR
jgi:hypothetical protein